MGNGIFILGFLTTGGGCLSCRTLITICCFSSTITAFDVDRTSPFATSERHLNAFDMTFVFICFSKVLFPLPLLEFQLTLFEILDVNFLENLVALIFSRSRII